MTEGDGNETEAVRVNRAYYEEASPGREDYWRFMAAPRARVGRILSLVGQAPVSSLIDLGCGGGRLLEEIGIRFPGVELAGIDLSRRQIEANRAAAPGVEWTVADLERAFPAATGLEGRWDAVVASEILEHLDDAAALLRNALRLSAPGKGRLVLTTQAGPIRETERRVGHRRHFTPEELVRLLSEAGWQEPRAWREGFPFHDLSKWWANRDPEASVRRFGERPYGRREKLVCAVLRAAFAVNSRSRGAQLYAVAVRGTGS